MGPQWPVHRADARGAGGAVAAVGAPWAMMTQNESTDARRNVSVHPPARPGRCGTRRAQQDKGSWRLLVIPGYERMTLWPYRCCCRRARALLSRASWWSGGGDPCCPAWPELSLPARTACPAWRPARLVLGPPGALGLGSRGARCSKDGMARNRLRWWSLCAAATGSFGITRPVWWQVSATDVQ